jgi:hypothetical protein
MAVKMWITMSAGIMVAICPKKEMTDFIMPPNFLAVWLFMQICLWAVQIIVFTDMKPRNNLVEEYDCLSLTLDIKVCDSESSAQSFDSSGEEGVDFVDGSLVEDWDLDVILLSLWLSYRAV